MAKTTNTKYTDQQGAPLSQDFPPQGEGGDRARRHPPPPPPHSHPFPLPTATRSPTALYPPEQDKQSPEEAGQGEREIQGEVTGQGSSLKMVQSAEGGKGRDKKKRIIVVVEAPIKKIILQMHTPARTSH